MSHSAAEQAEFEALDKEYQEYIRKLKVDWLAKNRMDSRPGLFSSQDVYEVMRPAERAEVHHRIAQWGIYITPFAEAWWKERGFAVVWPDDDSKPMQVFRLKTP